MTKWFAFHLKFFIKIYFCERRELLNDLISLQSARNRVFMLINRSHTMRFNGDKMKENSTCSFLLILFFLCPVWRRTLEWKREILHARQSEFLANIMSLITTKFHEILVSGFRGVALTKKKNRTDGSTDCMDDWLTDQKHYTLRNSMYGVKIKNYVFWNFIFEELYI